MRDWLIACCEWLLIWLRRPPVPDADAVQREARQFVQWAEGFAPGTSGEYKRHAVYAKMIRAFPDTRRRDLALAIEQAVQELP